MVPPLGVPPSRMSRYAQIQVTNKAIPLRSSVLDLRYGGLETDGILMILYRDGLPGTAGIGHALPLLSNAGLFTVEESKNSVIFNTVSLGTLNGTTGLENMTPHAIASVHRHLSSAPLTV